MTNNLEEKRIEGTFITFALAEHKSKTDLWNVVTKEGCAIGVIKWFGRWRQYAFFPNTDTVYEHVCLTEIAIFLRELTTKRLIKRRNQRKEPTL